MTINTKATKRVLIVDDQSWCSTSRDIIARFQHGHAYEITTARSIANALVILQRECFDLLNMVKPGIADPLLRRQGLNLLKRVGVSAPVLMIKRRLREPEGGRRTDRGAFGYLHKPFDLRELDRLAAYAIASATRG